MIPVLDPFSGKDLLKTHNVLMKGLAVESGRYRSGGIGVIKGKKIVHVAPPAKQVPALMTDLMSWLQKTDVHPFADGNGRKRLLNSC